MSSPLRLAWLASLGLGLGLGVCLGPGPALAQEPAIESGRWVVESRALDWPCRLAALEVVEAPRGGETTIVAFEQGGDGLDRRWGSSRLDRRATGPPSTRWFSAGWTSGGSTIGLQVRGDGSNRLVAIVRERPTDRSTPDRVRQVALGRADHQALASTAPIRFEVDPAAPRVETVSVFVAAEDGRDPRVVARAEGFARAAGPSWSPDGQRLAFAGFDASGRNPLIRVVGIEGGPSIAIASGVLPTWSSDGRRIAYVASGRLDYATDWSSLGRNDERIEAVTLAGPAAGLPEILARGIYPRWSPTDDRLAFVGRREANWDIYLRSADGLDQVRITQDPALDTQPVWLGDGRALVFLSDRGNRWDLYRASVDRPGLAIPLTNHARREECPSLSIDGRHVAFIDDRSRSNPTIQILDLDRGTVRPFPAHPDGDRDPAYAPDGRTIAFVSRRAGTIGRP